jgi:hypothetical protein
MARKGQVGSSEKYTVFIPIWPLWAFVFYRIEKLRLGILIIIAVTLINLGFNYGVPFPYGIGLALILTPWFPFFILKKWTKDWNARPENS